MKSRTLLALAAFIIAASVTPLHAVPITFNLLDTTATAQIESGILTRSGVTATLTPHVNGGSGSLHQLATGFGVDALGSGDNTHELDDVRGVESISITFDADVFFAALKLSDFGNDDHALLKIVGSAELNLDNSSGNAFAFSANNLVLAGETVVLKFGAGNGFSFDSFTVETIQRSTVPDFLPFTFTACFLFSFLAIAHKIGGLKQPAPAKSNQN